MNWCNTGYFQEREECVLFCRTIFLLEHKYSLSISAFTLMILIRISEF